MRRIAIVAVMLTAGIAQAQLPMAGTAAAPMHAPAPVAMPAVPAYNAAPNCHCDSPMMAAGVADDDGSSRRLFESDRAFPGFIGPISNPVLTKDPRSLTEVRALFVNNWFPEGNTVLGGGELQAYGLQA